MPTSANYCPSPKRDLKYVRENYTVLVKDFEDAFQK